VNSKCDISFPIPLPDDPRKWEGWSNYKSSNFYERLCLDPQANPSNEVIEEHCRELLRWWQKKLPLKNQPSNPLTQLLRSGLDESSRYLTEARVELLDPARRQVLDDELATRVREEATAEFQKYLAFATSNGVLTKEEEQNLYHFGSDHGLTEDEIKSLIEAEIRDNCIKRLETIAPPPSPAAGTEAKVEAAKNPQEEFLRMLRLSGLDSISMSDDQRDAFVNMAENLGLDAEEGEDLVDLYLDEADEKSMPKPAGPAGQPVVTVAPKPATSPATEAHKPVAAPVEINVASERSRYANFENSLGCPLLFVPSSEFMMGSDELDAAPNERPTTKVALSRYYLSRYPITNQVYEKFDPSHMRKRANGAGDSHPVVYVSSLEAIKFCEWLSARERKKYRLPTEAEWEYAARGNDGRKYPWGNYEGRGDLANFADKNTVFAWSDREIDDGYPESSPVGEFPRGVSPFGMEEMAGNVWEWCLDYFENYRGGHKVNPRGPTCGAKRVYRGGSWKSRFNSCRATARNSNVPSFSCNDLGFRIVCECE
jgi:formylglycine-generating enzyme required for sulfatase activity